MLARAKDGALGPDDTASPDLVDFLRVVDVPASGSAAWDRDLLLLVDTMSAGAEQERALTMLDTLAADPATAERGQEFYRRLDELAGAEPGDPRVAPLAAELADYSMEHLLHLQPGADWDLAQLEPFLDGLAPAQAEVVRQATRLIEAKFQSITKMQST